MIVKTRCMRCRVVIDENYGKTPTPDQQREIDAAAGMEKGRLMWRYTREGHRRFPNVVDQTAETDGPIIFCTKCPKRHDVTPMTYRPRQYGERLFEALLAGNKFLTLEPADEYFDTSSDTGKATSTASKIGADNSF